MNTPCLAVAPQRQLTSPVNVKLKKVGNKTFCTKDFFHKRLFAQKTFCTRAKRLVREVFCAECPVFRKLVLHVPNHTSGEKISYTK